MISASLTYDGGRFSNRYESPASMPEDAITGRGIASCAASFRKLVHLDVENDDEFLQVRAEITSYIVSRRGLLRTAGTLLIGARRALEGDRPWLRLAAPRDRVSRGVRARAPRLLPEGDDD